MKVTNQVKIILPAIRGNEAFARAAVAAFCAPLSPTIEEINDVKTAVSEAVTNVVVHAYPKEEKGECVIDVTIYDDAVLTVQVTDEGSGVSDVEEVRKPFYTTRSAEEHSGMGFTIMEAFMDSLEVFSEKGRGMSVIMRKKIGTHVES